MLAAVLLRLTAVVVVSIAATGARRPAGVAPWRRAGGRFSRNVLSLAGQSVLFAGSIGCLSLGAALLLGLF
jgi:hypothetical protein